MNGLKRVLALSPHADDVELGAGGLLLKLADSGANITARVLTNADEHDNHLKEECCTSLNSLGVTDVSFWGLPDMFLPEHRADILAVFSGMVGKYDLVLVPATWDTHQDHQTVTMEAMRVFKTSCLLGYGFPWNSLLELRLDFFVPLTEEELDKKLMALACYKSQQWRGYFDPEYVKGLARVRGQQIKIKYAEAFEVIRWIF